MEYVFLLKGIIIGFSLAVPIGPVGVMCIRKTLAHGSKQGIIVGLSAASADMFYGIVAAFGVTLVSDFISENNLWIRIIGGLLLFILGIKIYKSHTTIEKSTNGINGHARTFISTFLITLFNPMTVIAFAAVFAGIRIEKIAENYLYGGFLVAGVFLGSLLWFTSLSLLVRFFKSFVTSKGLIVINKIAGSLLIVFGLIMVLGKILNIC